MAGRTEVVYDSTAPAVDSTQGGSVTLDALAVTTITVDTPTITSGSGTPESAVTAPVGSLFLRTDGGASTTLYVKESGAGDTGWVAK